MDATLVDDNGLTGVYVIEAEATEEYMRSVLPSGPWGPIHTPRTEAQQAARKVARDLNISRMANGNVDYRPAYELTEKGLAEYRYIGHRKYQKHIAQH